MVTGRGIECDVQIKQHMASVLSPQDVPESARKHYTAIGLAEQRIFERRQDCQGNVEPQQGKTAKTVVVDWEIPWNGKIFWEFPCRHTFAPYVLAAFVLRPGQSEIMYQ